MRLSFESRHSRLERENSVDMVCVARFDLARVEFGLPEYTFKV